MISDTVNMLLERMKTNPDEFVNSEWDPVADPAWSNEPFSNTRWGNLIKAMYQTGAETMFIDEELEALKKAYGELLRTRCQECIVKELVSNEHQKEIDFRAKQMDLPYTTMTTQNRLGVERFRISGDGGLGIGVTSPAASIQIGKETLTEADLRKIKSLKTKGEK